MLKTTHLKKYAFTEIKLCGVYHFLFGRDAAAAPSASRDTTCRFYAGVASNEGRLSSTVSYHSQNNL